MATKKTNESKSLVTTDVAQLPADMAEEMAGIRDLGYSTKTEDSLIPIISILQDNSGEVKKKHSRFLDGAEPGMMIIRSLQRLFNGEVDAADPESGGIIFQPCGFQHVWVEWTGEPGEGGAPVMQYPFDDRPEDAVETDDPNNLDRKVWRMPNGNRLVDTRYHYGNLIGPDGILQTVIPCSGTNHTVSRGWTSLMKEFKVPGTNAPCPSWFRAYRLTTVFQQRGDQSWYKYQVRDMGWINNKDVRDAGRRMNEALGANVISADISTEGDEESDVPV